ncbi:alpha/beta hydrolase-fold protein [Aquimarina sediminis]|uniref:alpha/beta hydrolase-fold protein n=1 Tax=Aquimarina sediminis TaxID=2070536 RepID=UPI0013E8A362|nr:alpha/beta hydrolase-fold protein [Aquimarina sediminis]
MNNIVLPFFLFLNFANLAYSQENDIKFQIGERKSITSTILQEEREFQVYLPPSYFFNTKGNFPVVYVMDGDYNFHYDTGLIELLSSVSGKIPEMIVVGISDKGKTKYRKNCTPDYIPKREGNASNFMLFIENELKPYIHKNFRASDYKILIGHSIGGLFVANYFLQNPTAFDSYIAIDPALWPGNYEIMNQADTILKDKKKLDSNLFISLADTKQMGVRQFVGILDKYFPNGDRWNFMHFENENHNSVGLMTIKESLESIFENWEITRSDFYSFKSAQQIIDHYSQLSNDFSSSFTIPSYFLGNAIYYYYNHKKEDDLAILESEIKSKLPGSIDEFYLQMALNHFENEQYDKALEIYTNRITDNPLSFSSYEGKSKIYLKQGQLEKALEMSKTSIKIAKKCHVRQWMMNELYSNLDTIKSKIEKQ